MFMEGAGKSAAEPLTRAQFLSFVASHEQALKKAFQLFDKDGVCASSAVQRAVCRAVRHVRACGAVPQ